MDMHPSDEKLQDQGMGMFFGYSLSTDSHAGSMSSSISSAGESIGDVTMPTPGKPNNVNVNLAMLSNDDSLDKVASNSEWRSTMNRNSLEARVKNLEILLCHLTCNLNNLVQRPMEIRKSHLDQHCQDLFVEAPEPTSVQLNRLVSEMEMRWSGYGRKVLMSVARKWFRKRREEAGLKLAAALRKSVGKGLRERKGEVLEMLRDDILDIKELIRGAEIAGELANEAMVKFSKQKLISYVSRF